MKQHEIEVGKTYRNRKAGTTHRRVVALGTFGELNKNADQPRLWLWSNSLRADTPCVRFAYQGQGGECHGIHPLVAFAAWAGGVVAEVTNVEV